MSKIVIIEDKSIVPGSHNYLFEGFENSTFVDYSGQMHQQQSLDMYLHSFLSEKIIQLNPDCILIPCSLGEYHTEYMGIRLGFHLRLSRTFGHLRYIPIIFFSPDKLQIILRFNKLASIIGTPQCYLTRDIVSEIQSILDLNPSNLTAEDYLTFLSVINMDPPQNYLSVHSIANEWGAYRLDKIAGTEVLKQKDFPGMYSLYFKWLDAKSIGLLEIDDNEATSKNDIYTSKPVLQGLKPASISDEVRKLLEKNIEFDSKKRYRR